jgi:epoxyqueuosine reductase
VRGEEETRWVVEQARAAGFDLCGVAPAEAFEELARLPEWLARGYAGEMRYLHDPRRADPRRALPGARSIIVCALNYNTGLPYSTEVPASPAPSETEDETRIESETRHLSPAARRSPSGWISRYAWGDDYHDVLGRKLEALLAAMRGHFPEPFDARWYVDTGPVAERVAAHRAGLGWLARNTCLINEQLGSWLFLGVILTTLDLAASLAPAEAPPPDLCGNCRLCLDACPTGAIVEPYVLDARRCISYLTIELRGSIPEELRAPMGRMVFGCDICQDVCPWNRKAPATRAPRFQPRVSSASSTSFPSSTSLFHPALEFLASLTEDDFRRIFRGSAVRRAKWQGMVRNACVALGNALASRPSALAADSRARVVALLERLAASPDAVIAGHARWALARREAAPRGS